jgi:hypothetical protein
MSRNSCQPGSRPHASDLIDAFNSWWTDRSEKDQMGEIFGFIPGEVAALACEQPAQSDGYTFRGEFWTPIPHLREPGTGADERARLR